jgi:hypothetical protein
MGENEMNIALNLTVDQVNYILAVLGQRPFAEVSELVAIIKNQGDAIIQQNAEANKEVTPEA